MKLRLLCILFFGASISLFAQPYGGVEFDFTNDGTVGVVLPEIPEICGVTDYSIEFWIKVTEGEWNQWAGIYRFNTTANQSTGGGMDNSNWFFHSDKVDGTSAYAINKNFYLPADPAEWHHIAVVRDVETMDYQIKMYLDGELIMPSGHAAFETTAPYAEGASWDFGKDFNGYLKDFRIWSVPLVPEDIPVFMGTSDLSNHPDREYLIAQWKMDDFMDETALLETTGKYDGVFDNAVYIPGVLTTSISVVGLNNAESFPVEETLKMMAIFNPVDATYQQLTWSVDDPEVATIDTTGLLTGVGIGTVEVTATAKDGSGVSGSVSIDVIEAVNVDQYMFSQKYSVAVYPSVVSDILNVEITAKEQTVEIIQMSLYNMLGQNEYNRTIEGVNSKHQINMSSLSEGMHILKVSAGGQNQYIKVLKSK